MTGKFGLNLQHSINHSKSRAQQTQSNNILSPPSREVDFVLVVWSNAVLTIGLGERFA